MKIEKYESKEAAGEILAEKLFELKLEKPYIMAVLRGGVQVAQVIADKFKLPVHPLIVKKLPSPENPEYGFGAVTEDGTLVLNENAVLSLKLSRDIIEKIANTIVLEIQRRKNIFGELDNKKISESDVIIVDDGIATGYSLIAAINTVKKRRPKSITIAVPVSSLSAYSVIKKLADNIVCPLISSDYFFTVAAYYKTWSDLSEESLKFIIEDYKNKYSD
ncbi:MAG TPA: phosphoribosyltransferase family protein [Candidatus Gastranaerophilales bacterium]|nr:phosphoribosyltransferase family protein [Candidatus Gastranaerophilales bacterium]